MCVYKREVGARMPELASAPIQVQRDLFNVHPGHCLATRGSSGRLARINGMILPLPCTAEEQSRL